MKSLIKKGNQVLVLCGKDKGKKAEVIEILRSENKAKVKGINMIKKHEKTTKEKKGGIISKESFIHMSNLKNLDSEKIKINNSILVNNSNLVRKFYEFVKVFKVNFERNYRREPISYQTDSGMECSLTSTAPSFGIPSSAGVSSFSCLKYFPNC